MFHDNQFLISLPEFWKLNTIKVTNMTSMFENCDSLESLDLSKWNTINVSNMTSMFNNCGSLKSLDILK